MNKMKRVLSIGLTLLLVLPFNLMADSKPLVTSIEFSEIDPLMEIRNLTVEMAEDGYEDAEDGVQNQLQAINKAIADLDAIGFAPADPLAPLPYESAIGALLATQRASLVAQRKALLDTDLEEAELQMKMAIDSVTWGTELLYITYNNLALQVEQLIASKKLTEKQIAALKVQEELGMVTELAVEKAENELSGLADSITQLEHSRDRIKQQINIALFQGFDTDIEIGDVPRVLAPQITSIDVDSDYDDAWEESYDVLLNEDESAKEEDEILRKFEKSFYNSYETLMEKMATLEIEEDKMKVAQKSYNIAELKHTLGMISDLQFETEKNTQKTAVKLAEDAQFQAYRVYEWAKEGLIVSAGS